MFLRKIFLNTLEQNRFQRIAAIATTSYQRAHRSNTKDFSFEDENLQKYLETLRQEFYDLRVNVAGKGPAVYERMNQLNGIVKCLEQHRVLQENMASHEDIENEKDEDMRKLIEEENEVYTNLMRQAEAKIMKQVVQLTDDERYPSLIFEINAGVGGKEAMLFARELYVMYSNYFEHNGWNYEVNDEEITDIGGLRHANVIVYDSAAFDTLRYEAGVHRVQRVPATEKSGRIHTSTASVTVIPRPADVNVTIAEKDLKIETKRASGAGGQHVNTTDSAVRVVHLPTGLAVESQSERSQIKNREIAIKRLQAKLVQQQLEKVESKKQATRKAQQGNLDRNEKIRTYNFVQDRITDHRIPDGTVHNLQVFLEGGEHLDSLIQRLVMENRRANFEQLIASWPTADTRKAEMKGNEKPQQETQKS